MSLEDEEEDLKEAKNEDPSIVKVSQIELNFTETKPTSENEAAKI